MSIDGIEQEWLLLFMKSAKWTCVEGEAGGISSVVMVVVSA